MVSWFIPLFFAGVFFAVLLTIIPLHNIENESYFEYYALLWSHVFISLLLSGAFSNHNRLCNIKNE